MRTAFLLGLLVTAAALAAVSWFAPRREAAPDRRVLLDTVVEPGADGRDLSFRLDVPGRVEVRVEGPPEAHLAVTVGPPSPVNERTGTWRPDPQQAFVVTGAGRVVATRDLLAVGTYVVRVDPVPTAMETTCVPVSVRVARVPVEDVAPRP